MTFTHGGRHHAAPRRCRQHALPPLPSRVVDPASTVATMAQFADVDGSPQTVALMVDCSTSGVTVAQKPNAAFDDDFHQDLLTMCNIMADSDDDDPTELVILASWRPGTHAQPNDKDRACWKYMAETMNTSRTVHLVDWLLVDGDTITSMSTEFGR